MKFGRLHCTDNQQLCVRTFRSFDTRPRIASAVLSFPLSPLPEWLYFPFLPPFLPLPDFSLPFPFRDIMASTSIGLEVVLKMRLLLK